MKQIERKRDEDEADREREMNQIERERDENEAGRQGS